MKLARAVDLEPKLAVDFTPSVLGHICQVL
jgi:hypothetical protein